MKFRQRTGDLSSRKWMASSQSWGLVRNRYPDFIACNPQYRFKRGWELSNVSLDFFQKPWFELGFLKPAVWYNLDSSEDLMIFQSTSFGLHLSFQHASILNKLRRYRAHQPTCCWSGFFLPSYSYFLPGFSQCYLYALHLSSSVDSSIHLDFLTFIIPALFQYIVFSLVPLNKGNLKI